jgi:hypothetical protein
MTTHNITVTILASRVKAGIHILKWEHLVSRIFYVYPHDRMMMTGTEIYSLTWDSNHSEETTTSSSRSYSNGNTREQKEQERKKVSSYTDLRPCSEAGSNSDSQKIPCLLWKHKVH